MRVDGQELMNSASHGSEEKLAVFGARDRPKSDGRRVLDRGPRHGFHRPRRARRPRVRRQGRGRRVRCGRGALESRVLGHLAGAPLADPRLSVLDGDVVDAIAKTARRYDAILLDVDNGPSALSSFKNRRLYSEDGLRKAPARAPAGRRARGLVDVPGRVVHRAPARGRVRPHRQARPGGRRNTPPSRPSSSRGTAPRRSFPDSKGSVMGAERAPSLMAKTWVPKTGIKSARAFAKAMRRCKTRRAAAATTRARVDVTQRRAALTSPFRGRVAQSVAMAR